MLRVRSKLVFPLLFLLSFCLIENVKSRRGKPYCKVTSHEFFLEVGLICKRCDRCGPGMELVPLEKSNIDMSVEHGALGCQECKRCDEGYFSKGFSFKPCKKCKECASIGKIMIKKCTSFSNAKCGKRIETITTVSEGKEKPAVENSTSVSIDMSSAVSTGNNIPTNHIGSNKTIVILLLALLILTVMSFIGIVVKLYRKNCRNRECKGSVSKNKRNSISFVNIKSERSCIPSNDLSVDGPFTEEDRPLMVIPDECGKNEIPTEIQLQFVARFIAPNQCYRRVGIRLGISDNNICIIEEENNHLVTRAFKVLQKWTQVCADGATINVLLQALLSEERNDLVSKFISSFREEFASQHYVLSASQNLYPE